MHNLSFVALDLETTGLDDNAEIIEVGLVKVKGGQIVDKYETLIKPSHAIPEEITILTGIDNDMVALKPTWQQVKEEILNFIGDNIIIAHNVSFDRKFVESYLGYQLTNLWVDTYDLAKIALPMATSYKLSYLTQLLEISIKNAHRALFDAEACVNVLLSLLELVKKLSPFTLEAIINILLIENKENGLELFLKNIQKFNIANYSFVEKVQTNQLDHKETGKPILSFSQVEKFFEPRGILELNNEVYEYRPQQINLLRIICEALEKEKHAILEAGTGTGKSFAYLIPALLWALEKNCKIVVSTNTIALQEQLFKTDIPFINKCFGYDFPVALCKGRNNYLCIRRYNKLKSQSKILSWSEKIFLAQMESWLTNTQTGDKEELNLNPLEEQQWKEISSQSDLCLNNKCSYYGKCFYMNNRREGEKSKLLITNHALLLQDIKYQNKILPKYDYVIIDEAHNLEEETIKQFTNVVDIFYIRKLFNQIAKGKYTGLLNRLKNQVKKEYIEEKQNIISLVEQLEEEIFQATKYLTEVINAFYDQKNLFNLGEKRITSKERQEDWWLLIEKTIKRLFDHFVAINARFTALINKIEIIENLEDLNKEFCFIQAELWSIKDNLNNFIHGQDQELVYWIEISNSLKFKNVSLHMAPINVGEILRDFLFDNKKSVILTSATLAVNNKLNYFADTLALKDNDYYSIISQSPFNYQNQSLICIPTDLPDPTNIWEEEYVTSIIVFLKKIIPVITGGILILFTSYNMLNTVYYELKRDTNLFDRDILAHGKDGSRINLIKSLKNKTNTVVLGTNSFWEGIDVKGISLTTVIIVKLPFLPPTRPITATKMELMEIAGKNSFYNYSLPQAILKFRQGYGRLIRSNQDWGALIILDNRVLSKRYGKHFLTSIPEQKIIKGTTEYLSTFLPNWMNDKHNK